MHVNSQKIIDDSRRVFLSSENQLNKYNSLTSWIDEESYKKLHKSFLTSIDVKINEELFSKEILEYSSWFEQWGGEHLHLPRKGLALVNQTGDLIANDPVNGSLYEYNFKNPNQPLLEIDFVKETEVMTMLSLEPLNFLKGKWIRSNILHWGAGAHFKPHIDNTVPSPWIRLWGTTTNDIKLRYAVNDQLVEVNDVEPGRLYVIDTSIVHDAWCYSNEGYQFFLCCSVDSYDTLLKLT
jgi:hypothetical protein